MCVFVDGSMPPIETRCGGVAEEESHQTNGIQKSRERIEKSKKKVVEKFHGIEKWSPGILREYR